MTDIKTESEQTATPRPWPKPVYDNDTGANDESFYSWWEIEGVAKFDNEADAFLAWKATNSYEAMREALELVAKNCHIEGCTDRDYCDCLYATAARTALARADEVNKS